MTESAIIEKIKKLFRLASSDNENEAQLALQRAYELMEKYNIDMDALKDDPFQEKRYTVNTAAQPIEQPYIFQLLQHFFHVIPITVTGQLASYDRRYQYRLAGTEMHVLIAEYVHDYLLTVFRKLWRDYRKKMSKKLKAKTVKNRHHQYLNGLMQGVWLKLREAQRQVQSEYGIVKVDDAALKKWVEENGCTEGDTMKLKDGEHMLAGLRDAQHVNIHKGVEGAAVGPKQLGAGGSNA